MKVQNMQSGKGNTIANQFIIRTNEGNYFQSYRTVIAFIPDAGKVQLDAEKWDYSRTTAKYRNLFLGMTTKEITQALDNGTIELVNLNK